MALRLQLEHKVSSYNYLAHAQWARQLGGSSTCFGTTGDLVPEMWQHFHPTPPGIGVPGRATHIQHRHLRVAHQCWSTTSSRGKASAAGIGPVLPQLTHRPTVQAKNRCAYELA